ncbi:MAG: hypothetical protein IJ806_11125 [Ruminococcus sp.]|nr:hypothetical protein [Ruminococcus sp.]
MTRRRRTTTAFRVALGGICTAVCLLLMFCSTFLPVMSYTAAIFSGFLMVVMIVEADMTYAVVTYFAVSLLSVFITPNYEASLLFIMFMGYYPMVKFVLDRSLRTLPRRVIKFLMFNAAVTLYYNVFKYFFTSVDMLEGMEMFGRYALLVLWLLAQVCFVTSDFALTALTEMYITWFRRKILRRK